MRANCPFRKRFLDYPQNMWITLCTTGAWQAKCQNSCGLKHFAQRGSSWAFSIKSMTYEFRARSKKIIWIYFLAPWQAHSLWISAVYATSAWNPIAELADAPNQTLPHTQNVFCELYLAGLTGQKLSTGLWISLWTNSVSNHSALFL